MSFLFRAPRAAAFPAIAVACAVLLSSTGFEAVARAPAAKAQTAPKKDAAATTSVAAVDRSAWLYKDSDIPQDPDWHFGTLPNGLRYAVRKNGVPPGQVAVRVRVDAGSLFETDSERGFAHFIEHLTFRGSAYVPDGEAKRIWQRMGTTFGSDTNAQTTPTQTVFKLDLPGATEAGLDESLHIMSGMMEKPAITPEAVAAERPVVLAEQRELPGAQVRFGDAVRATFFAGQPLANRSPIGNIKTLEAATADTVKAFHDRWYRPERTVVIISGDIDPDVAERLVIKNFSGWVRNDPKPADPDFGKPDASQPATRLIVEPSIPTVISWAVLRPWQFNNDTIIFNQKRLVDQVAVRVINRRLESRARSGGSFLQAAVQLNDESRSANGTFVDILPAGDDWEKAVKDVRAVIADAAAAPPTQAEIDRELAELDAAMKNQVDTQAAEAGAKEADDLVEALDIRETVTSAKGSYDVLQGAEKAGMFNPDAILASTRRVFVGTATHAAINLHAPDPTAANRLAAVLTADVSGLAGARKALAKVDFSKLPPLGSPGTVTSREKLGSFGSEKVVFSNGVRMIVFPSASEAGRVYVRVRWGGGYASLSPR
ncbi:MAG: M16 family metallopeptidase, partial [Sphingomonas sp.]